MAKISNVVRLLLLVLISSISSYATSKSGPIAYYSFDENAYDFIGGYDGELFGDAHYVDGVLGRAVSFDGNGDFVQIEGTPLIGDKRNWSIVGHVKLYSDNHRHSIFGEYSANPTWEAKNYISYSRQVDGGYGLHYDNYKPGGGPQEKGRVSIGNWHAFAFVRKGSRLLTYIDGIKTSEVLHEVYDGNPAVVSAFGSRLQSPGIVYTPGNPTKYAMNSALDEVYVFHRALDDAEVESFATERRFYGFSAPSISDAANDGWWMSNALLIADADEKYIRLTASYNQNTNISSRSEMALNAVPVPSRGVFAARVKMSDINLLENDVVGTSV